MLKPRILVTRPQPQADEWVRALREHHLDAHALPLIGIEGPVDPKPIEEAWRCLGQQRLLMFVSPAAVDWFFRIRPAEAMWPLGTLAAAPGPGTAARLIQAGASCGLSAQQIVSPSSESQQFDSESLWPLLAPMPWQGQSVLIISGGDQQEARGRTWLAEQLRAQGATVAPLLTYRRGPGRWDDRQQDLARAALVQPERYIWLFSSSQGIDHLITTHLPDLPACPDTDWSKAIALCTHPRISARASAMGITQMIETHPDLQAVMTKLSQSHCVVSSVDTISTL